MRFFKHIIASNKVVSPRGRVIEFESNDAWNGYLQTDNQQLCDVLTQYMRENRYGISEISPDEYDRDFVQKKTNSTGSKPRWREEIGSGMKIENQELVATAPSSVQVAAVEPAPVATPAAMAASPAAIADATSQPPRSAQTFTPNVGRRGKPKQ